jgi:hypothetical protein
MVDSAAETSASKNASLYSARRLVDLQEELRKTGQSTSGSKAVLIDRLLSQEKDGGMKSVIPEAAIRSSPQRNPFLQAARGRQRHRLEEDASSGSSLARSASVIRDDALRWSRHSWSILRLFFSAMASSLSVPFTLTALMTVVTLLSLWLLDGPQQTLIAPYREAIEGYGLFFGLGFLSALGFGGWLGGQLGRWTAQVATAVSSCGAGDLRRMEFGEMRCFSKFDASSLSFFDHLVRATNWTRVISLAAPEAASWAAGSVLANLFLFALGRAQRGNSKARPWHGMRSSFFWFVPLMNWESYFAGRDSSLSTVGFALQALGAFTFRYASGSLVAAILFNKSSIDRIARTLHVYPELQKALHSLLWQLRRLAIILYKEESWVAGWVLIAFQASSVVLLGMALAAAVSAVALRKQQHGRTLRRK